jgi:hypothetical protein
VKITVERCDEFFVTVLEIFDRVKSVALWSAKKRTIKGYGSATIVEDASKLRSAIVMASRKHTTAKPYSRGGRVFKARSFFVASTRAMDNDSTTSVSKAPIH